MSKMKDLTNKRFGKLVAIEPRGRKNKRVVWFCQCDCGNTSIVASDKLQNGHTQSCGCLIKQRGHERVIDLTGKRYGRLTVIEKVGYKGNEITWKCKCDCGTVTEVKGVLLRNGATKSCGCLARELSYERLKKYPSQSRLLI